MKFHRLFVPALLVLGLLASFGAAWQQHRINAKSLADETRDLGNRIVERATAQIDRAALSLSAARAFVLGAGVDSMTRDDFRHFAELHRPGHAVPGVASLGMIRRVARGSEQDFVDQVHRLGDPAFQVQEIGEPGAERRIVQWIEPVATNLGVPGLDLASEANRLATSDLALQTGSPSLTGPIELVRMSRGDGVRGLLMMLALPPSDMPGYGIARGPQALVYARIDLIDLLDTEALRTDRVAMDLADVTDPGQVQDFGLPITDPQELQAAQAISIDRRVMGRQWRFTLTPRPSLVESLHPLSPALVASFGVAATLPLALLAHTWMRLRQRTGQALAERTRLLSMLDHAGDAFIGLDLGGRVMIWNRAAERLFDYRADEALGRPLSSLTLAAEHQVEEQRLLQEAASGRSMLPIETRRRHRDGTMLDVELSAGPMYDEAGRVIGVVKVLRSVRERVEQRRQLRAWAERLEAEVASRTVELQTAAGDLRNVLDAMPSMVSSWDRQLINRFANRAYASHYGRTLDAIRGERLEDLLGPVLFEVTRAHVARALDGHEQVFERELPMRDGSTRQTLVNYVPQRDHEGQVIGFYALVHDVTEIKQAQQLLHAAMDAIDDGFVVWGPDDRLVLCNERFGERFGDESHLIVPGVSFEMVQRLGAEHGSFPEAIGRVQEWVVEQVRQHRAGDSTIVLEMAEGRVVRNTERHLADGHVVGVCVDITELESARRAAESASRAKSEFLAVTSHEIRTPLNAILGLAYLLERAELEPAQQAQARQISQAGRSLLALLNDVLDLSKIEAGQLEIEARDFELRPLIENEVALLSAGSRASNLEVRLSIDNELPAVVHGDGLRLRQVLHNLLSNAIKFTERGAVSVALRRGAETSQVVLEVSDTGIGIDAETRQRLFKPFMQADASTTRRFGGTGLGLSIIAKLVSLMGGRVDLDSTPGVGSRFTVTLPLPEGDSEPTAAGHVVVSRSRPLRVLFSAMDPVEGQRLQALARSLGWECQAAEGAQAMLEACKLTPDRRSPFDALVLDAGSIAAQGGDVVERLRATRDGQGRPAIIVAGEAGLVELKSLDPVPLSCPANGSTLFDAVNRGVAALQGLRALLPLASTTGEHAVARLPGLSILVVDDSDLNLDVARKVLELEGAQVETCNSGEAALRWVAVHAASLDAILLDVQMPGMDGIEVVRRLRAMPSCTQMPVIALSAGVLREEREAALRAGMSEFVPKPLEPDRLIACLRQQVERYRGRPVGIEQAARTETGVDTGSGSGVSDEAWPDIPGIAPSTIASALRGDRPLWLSMLRRLLDEFAHVADEPAAALPARLHKLRGGAHAIGANLVAGAAGVLENLAREELKKPTPSGDGWAVERANLRRNLQGLQASAQPVLAREAQRLQARQDVEARQAQVSGAMLDPGELARLRQLIEQQDIRASEQVEALAAPLAGSIGASRLARLRQALQDFDFQAAAEALGETVEA